MIQLSHGVCMPGDCNSRPPTQWDPGVLANLGKLITHARAQHQPLATRLYFIILLHPRTFVNLLQLQPCVAPTMCSLHRP